MRARGLLAASLSGLAGCSFGIGGDGARYHCGAGEGCPPGLSCIGGFCQLPGDGGSAGDDGGDPVDDGPCGTMSLLSDDFDDGVEADRLRTYSDPGTTVGVSDGELQILFAAPGSEEVWGGVRSTLRYRLRGGEVRAEVVEAGGAFTVLELRPYQGPKIQLLVEDGTTLRATLVDAPGGTVEVDETYEPDLHRIWRVREAGGELHFETAPQATEVDWHSLAVLPIPFEDDVVEVLLSAAGRSGDPPARLASINRDLAEPAGYCPVSQLVDGFEAPPLEPSWSSSEQDGCSIAEAEGALAVDFTASGPVWCGADSQQLYDLSGSAVTAAIEPPSASGDDVVVGVWAYEFARPDTFVQMARDGGSIVFRRSNAGEVATGSRPYSSDDRYFRLRGAGSRILGETSADGEAWQLRFDEESPLDLTAVQISVQGGLDEGGEADGQAVISGVNAD